MNKALVYNRKSRGELEDLQKNKTELLNYCRKNDLEATYFEEIGSSVDASRQEFIKLQNKIKTGKYQLLVIIDLSRLTRDLKTQLELFELLEEYGMEIHSILDGRIDPKNSSNEILSVIKGIFNQATYKEISRKMALGRVQAAKQGKFLVRIPFGYRKDDTHKLFVYEDEAMVVRKIFEYYTNGHSTTEISRLLSEENLKTHAGGEFSTSTISRILQNRVYLGETNYNAKSYGEDIRIENTHEALVELGTFLQAQHILTKNKKLNERAHPSINPLNKLVRCGLCGRLMRINFVGKGKKYVYIQKCPATVNNEKCNNSGVNVKYVMPLIYETIRNRIPIIEQKLDEIHKGTFNDRIKKMNRELKLLNNKLTTKKRNKDKLLDVLLSDSITTLVFTEKNNELDIEINGLEKMIDDQKNLIAQNQVSDSTEYLEQLLDDLINIEDVEVEEQNRIFKKIFDTIEYYNVDGQIDLKIYFK